MRESDSAHEFPEREPRCDPRGIAGRGTACCRGGGTGREHAAIQARSDPVPRASRGHRSKAPPSPPHGGDLRASNSSSELLRPLTAYLSRLIPEAGSVRNKFRTCGVVLAGRKLGSNRRMEVGMHSVVHAIVSVVGFIAGWIFLILFGAWFWTRIVVRSARLKIRRNAPELITLGTWANYMKLRDIDKKLGQLTTRGVSAAPGPNPPVHTQPAAINQQAATVRKAAQGSTGKPVASARATRPGTPMTKRQNAVSQRSGRDHVGK